MGMNIHDLRGHGLRGFLDLSLEVLTQDLLGNLGLDDSHPTSRLRYITISK